MKKGAVSISLLAALVSVFAVGLNQAAAFGEGSWSESVASCLGVRSVQVAPYIRVGYQRMGVNLNVPIGGIRPDWFTMNDMDVKLDRQEFLIGTLGLNTLLRQRFGFFAEASASAQRAGSVTTVFTNLAVPAIPTNPTGWSWPSQQVQWLELNFGGSFRLLDSGTLLLGYKFDRLTQVLTDPPNAYVLPTATAHNNFGDLDIRTYSPYVGLRFDDKFVRIDLIWSPFLTSYNAQMPLRITLAVPGEVAALEGRYGLSGGGGNLLEAYGEGKFNIFDLLAAKLWLKASWLKCQGNGNRDFVGNDIPFGSWSNSDSANGSLTAYLWAFGLAGEIKF